MATNCSQQVNPFAFFSAFVYITAFWNAVFVNICIICPNMGGC